MSPAYDVLMQERVLTNLTVFLGSSAGGDPAYELAAAKAAECFATNGHTIVYGGGRVGLMGVVAEAALRSGGDVIGIMTQLLVDKETAHRGLTRLEVVDTVRARRQRMADLASAFVAFPGGTGTFEEFFESWNSQLLGLHTKPVALLNSRGFWDPLVATVDHMVAEGFLAAIYRERLIVEEDPAVLLERLRSWEPPPPKWTHQRISP